MNYVCLSPLLPGLAATLLLLILGGCQISEEHGYRLHQLESPAAPGSGQSNLAAKSSGEVYLSWIEPGLEHEHALKHAVLEPGAIKWGKAVTFVEGDNWFVNWADFPSLLPLKNNLLAVHWLEQVPGEWYAYHVSIAFKNVQPDSTLSEAIRPHFDDSPTEHGFVSMVPLQDDRILAVWLDGRNMTGAHESGEMTLRSAEVSTSGKILNSRVIDGRVCECCQTSAAQIGASTIIAYRDRSDGEIRDISLSRYYNGQWSEPQVAHEDNWHFMGCPVNGPVLTSSGDHGGLAWYTGSGEEAVANYVHLNESLDDISNPIRIDDGNPLGRVDAVMQQDGTAWVSWVEKTEDGAENRLRRIDKDGSTGESITLHPLSPERQSGFPRMAISDDRIIITWIETGEEDLVKTGFVELY
ncbi:MAG: hypothetical protein WD491_02545 [Balneolales bacterium]